jgi:hypothetical protein
VTFFVSELLFLGYKTVLSSEDPELSVRFLTTCLLYVPFSGSGELSLLLESEILRAYLPPELSSPEDTVLRVSWASLPRRLRVVLLAIAVSVLLPKDLLCKFFGE